MNKRERAHQIVASHRTMQLNRRLKNRRPNHVLRELKLHFKEYETDDSKNPDCFRIFSLHNTLYHTMYSNFQIIDVVDNRGHARQLFILPYYSRRCSMNLIPSRFYSHLPL
jgi:hypothetical protein